MKRGLESGEDATSAEGPAAKKANKEAQSSEEPDQCNEFITKNRNRALQLELASKKRIISESRWELELLRKKSREMEVLVSLIQRAWSQLDIDASLLLDSLGDPEAVVSERGAGDMLYRFLQISSKYYQLDPTSDSVPALSNVDEYSNAEEIQRAKQRAESTLHEDLADSAALEEHLSGHVAFTLSLLEKLCNAINDNSLVIPEQSQQNMVQIKESYSKILFLKDEVVKLRAEVLAQRAKLIESENNALRATKRLDKALLTISSMEEAQRASAARTGMDSGSAPASSASGTAAAAGEAGMNEAMQTLQSKISVLEQQLAESESAKAAVEMRYTERISRPTTHSEGFVQDLRKAMEDLRAQCKARVSSLITENEALQEKVRDLTLAMEKIEAGAAQRIEQFAAVTETELCKLRTEKAALEARLVKFTNDRNVLDQTKRSVADYQAIDATKEIELRGLQKQVTDLMSMLATVRANLLASQERELALEKNILEHNLPLPQDVVANPQRRDLTGRHFQEDSAATTLTTTASSGKMAVVNSNSETNDREHGEIVEPVHPNVVVLQHQHARIQDLNNELADCKNTINDLITEIDGMATATSQLWTQNESLTKQLGDSQSLQNAILEENVSLQNGIETARREQKEAEARMENMRKLMAQHEGLLAQLRNEEAAVQAALLASQKTYHQVNASRHSSEQLVAELKQQIASFEQQVSQQNKKNEELAARCQELSKQAAKERKARQQLERSASQHASSRAGETASGAAGVSGGGASSTMTQDDADMLDMTLNMLKCSVCKDRFKSVTITRCFHLFCRECIEENIRNRSRKCPACGEKFGQDDVANVYFTH